jgi:ribose 5-phosphate isomerase A
LERFGDVKLRLKNDAAWLTDAGNFIYDVFAGPLENPGETDRLLRAIPGVVETGLFVGRADRVIVAGESGISELTPRR